MPVVKVLNATLGSYLLFILIYADYRHKYDTDSFQRSLFIRILVFSGVALMGDAASLLLEGQGGGYVRPALYAVLTVYYFFQAAALYYTALLFDYLSYKDPARVKTFKLLICLVLILHGVILAANLGRGFYFNLDGGNHFIRGGLYAIRLVIAYAPGLLIILDLILASKAFKKSQLYLCGFFILLTGGGSVLDILLGGGSVLVWPCYASSLLYVYFAIVRSDAKLDSLTGIGNRYSFNEFIDGLEKDRRRQPYTIVMIDVDHFKAINDTLGHQEGDNALRDLAGIIKRSIRHTDFAARYGGDEFVVAARAETDMARILERIHEAIRVQNEKGNRPYKIEISHGSAVFTPDSGQSIKDFLAYIDSKMYEHKTERRLINSGK
jgi:diguanylate cyclase (GGDEF)-like protein